VVGAGDALDHVAAHAEVAQRLEPGVEDRLRRLVALHVPAVGRAAARVVVEVDGQIASRAETFSGPARCRSTYAREPSRPCSSPPQSAMRMVRRGRASSARRMRIASIATATPSALSAAPTPRVPGVEVRADQHDLVPQRRVGARELREHVVAMSRRPRGSGRGARRAVRTARRPPPAARAGCSARPRPPWRGPRRPASRGCRARRRCRARRGSAAASRPRRAAAAVASSWLNGTALTPISPGARSGAPVRTGPSDSVGCGRSARVNTVCGACASTIAPRSRSPDRLDLRRRGRRRRPGGPRTRPRVDGVHASA
jgi:hypothetical protein